MNHEEYIKREKLRVAQSEWRKDKPLYSTWINMKQRCLNPKFTHYQHYGGRGISIYPLWVNDFDAFCRDVGERPSELHTLDRIDNDGNYEPGNVRWSTMKEQNMNKRLPARHSTGVKGLSKLRNGWMVRLYIGSKDNYIGWSTDRKTAEIMHTAAIKAYEATRKYYEGEDK